MLLFREVDISYSQDYRMAESSIHSLDQAAFKRDACDVQP